MSNTTGIVIYPKANSSDRAERGTSERNLANRSAGLVRNRIIKGMSLVTSPLTNGYYIRILNDESLRGTIESENSSGKLYFSIGSDSYTYDPQVNTITNNATGQLVTLISGAGANASFSINSVSYEIVSLASNQIILKSGECLIGGYRIKIERDIYTPHSLVGYGNKSIYLHLVKNDALGTLDTIEMINEDEVTNNYGGRDGLINHDAYSGDYLYIGAIVDGELKPYEPAKTPLRAQDIYVQGPVPTDPLDPASYKYSGLNSEGTLDEYLVRMIISDGQFNE